MSTSVSTHRARPIYFLAPRRKTRKPAFSQSVLSQPLTQSTTRRAVDFDAISTGSNLENSVCLTSREQVSVPQGVSTPCHLNPWQGHRV